MLCTVVSCVTTLCIICPCTIALCIGTHVWELYVQYCYVQKLLQHPLYMITLCMYNRRYYGLTYNTSHHLLRYKDITPQSSVFITSKSFNSHLFKYEPLGLKQNQKYKDVMMQQSNLIFQLPFFLTNLQPTKHYRNPCRTNPTAKKKTYRQ